MEWLKSLSPDCRAGGRQRQAWSWWTYAHGSLAATREAWHGLLHELPLRSPLPQDIPCWHLPRSLFCLSTGLPVSQAAPARRPFLSILMYGLAFLVSRFHLHVHIGTGVCSRGREISQHHSVNFLLPNQASSASATVCTPSRGHRDTTSFHCALGPLGPPLKLCVPRSWDTSRFTDT